LHSRDLTNFCILKVLLIKTQVAKTKEIIKLDGCNVIIQVYINYDLDEGQPSNKETKFGHVDLHRYTMFFKRVNK
jgi:hypothetical protein